MATSATLLLGRQPLCAIRIARASRSRIRHTRSVPPPSRQGTPLNRLSAEMEKRGIVPGSPESKLAGRRILSQLTEAFGRMILGAGFIHGDPHPGNIFVQEGGKVALIDCGQVRCLDLSSFTRSRSFPLCSGVWGMHMSPVSVL